MAIESISGTTINRPLSAKSVTKDATDVKQETAASGKTDTIDITSTSQDIIKTAVAVGAATPLINEDRVAAIKSALQSGSYNVDAGRVAEKMLQFDASLPNST